MTPATLSIQLRPQHRPLVAALLTGLDQGTLTTLRALEGLAHVRQQGQGKLADVLTATVQAWHDAYRCAMTREVAI
jgi:hypothetical protein